MRLILSSLLCSILLCNYMPAVAQGNAAVEHLNQITVPFGTLKKDTWLYLKSITRGKGARTVDKNRKNLLQQYKTVEKEVSKLSGYNGDASLKTAALTYLSTCYKVLNEDYSKLVDMEEIAEQSYDQMEAYMTAKEMASEKLNEASDNLQQAQKDYGAKYDITIVEGETDKLTAKIVKASNALKYYNKVYLVFFKCYKQEMYVLDAMQRADMSALQQNINALKTCAESSQELVKELEAYSGDASLKVAVRNALTFYAKEAEKDFAATVDYYLKKDKFDALAKAMQANTNRTQQDVDAYNKAVADFNADTQAFNKLNDATNKQRAEMLKLWNQATENFFANHTE